MIRRIAVTLTVLLAFGLSSVGATGHMGNVPKNAHFLAHVSGSTSTSAGTGTWSVNVYRVPGATTAPKGSTVYNVKREIAAENSKQRIHTDNSCTRGCGYWNFGCPGTYYEAIKWDEQDVVGTPLYHQEMDVEAGVNCKNAWTVWRNVQNCATYGLGWSCVQPIPNGRFWDGSWEQNWSNTTFHWQWPIPVIGCENDLLPLRLATGPGGGIWGRAYSPQQSYC